MWSPMKWWFRRLYRLVQSLDSRRMTADCGVCTCTGIMQSFPVSCHMVEEHFEFRQHYQFCLVSWLLDFALLLVFQDLSLSGIFINICFIQVSVSIKCPESPVLWGLTIRPEHLQWTSHKTHNENFSYFFQTF